MFPQKAYYEIKGQVAMVTIKNPPLNCLDATTKEDIGWAFKEIAKFRPGVRAVVITGFGGKAFAAGADLKSFLDFDPKAAKAYLSRSQEIYKSVRDFPCPVIAAIKGYCLGGGLELALHCDIRYASQTAKLGFPEVNHSLFPGHSGARSALQHIPLGKLKELVFTGRLIDAKEAFRLGLVEEVFEPEKVLENSLNLAREIATKGPLGVTAAKKALNISSDPAGDQGIESVIDLWAGLTATNDMKEGVKAFMEKRPPDFKAK
jgi:enoyl-CoA hydratase/carnithine racemase